MLLNVNMVEAELAAKNVELKKGKPGYNPYAEEDVDELGNVRGWVGVVLHGSTEWVLCGVSLMETPFK